MKSTLLIILVLSCLYTVQCKREGSLLHRLIKRQAEYDVSAKSEEVGEPREGEEDSGEPYLLPASSTNVLTKKRINNQLVCPGAGIYADVNNNCQIFHICHYSGRPDGSGFDLRQYSFFCGNTTVFDQYTLTCTTPDKAIPCEYAPEFYDINKRTDKGRKDVFIHQEEDKEKIEPYYDVSSSRMKKQLQFV